MQKKINIFLLIVIFLCSFTLSSCESKSYLASYYDLKGMYQEFIIENKEIYELRVDEALDIELYEERFELHKNKTKPTIKANEEYFEIYENRIVPIKECENEKVVVYSGMNRAVFYVNAKIIDKYIDLEVTLSFGDYDKLLINFGSIDATYHSFKKFDINDFIVGDIIRMYYNGQYGQTHMSCNNDWWGGEIIKIEKIYDAIPYTFVIDENYVPIIVDNDIDYKFRYFAFWEEGKYYVINENNYCTTTDKLEIGQVLYGFAWGNNPNEIASLYTYNPKE